MKKPSQRRLEFQNQQKLFQNQQNLNVFYVQVWSFWIFFLILQKI